MRRSPLVILSNGDVGEIQTGDSLLSNKLFVDDFMGTTLLAIYGTMTAGGGASGAVNTAGNLVQGVCGVLTLKSGTGATGARGINTGQNNFLIGGKYFGFGCAFYLPVISDATNRFTIRIGASGAVTTIGDSTGIYFRYNDSVSGGQIQCVCRNGATETVLNSGIVPVANTVYELYFLVNNTGTSVQFFINDNLIGSITTNIPSTATALGLFALIQKSIGSTARTFCIDKWYTEVIK